MGIFVTALRNEKIGQIFNKNTPPYRPISSVTSHHVTLRTGGQANVNKLLIPLRVTIEESNKAKYFEVLAPWLTFVPFMGAQIVLIDKRIEVIFDCQR